jgi:hypothetical protein
MTHIELATGFDWETFFAIKGELACNEMFRRCRIGKITLKQQHSV